MFEGLNLKKRTVKEGINTDNMDFAPLKNFTGQQVLVDGYFFTQGRYGKQVVVVGNGFLINMPQRAVDQFEVIDSKPEMIEAVLSGKLVMNDIKMMDTRNGVTTAYTLADR